MKRKTTTLVWMKFNFTAPNTYTLEIKAKDTNNHLIADKSVMCRFKNKSVVASPKKQIALIKKNVTNLIEEVLPQNYSIKYFVDSGSSLWKGDKEAFIKKTLVTGPAAPIVKVNTDLATKRIWQVALINGNWTIVRAKNEYLSKEEATERLIEKIQGQ